MAQPWENDYFLEADRQKKIFNLETSVKEKMRKLRSKIHC